MAGERVRHSLLTSAGLSNTKLASIGAIAVLSAHTEDFTERAIWELDGKPERGERPWTDGKPISAWVAHLEKLGPSIRKPGLSKLVGAWCHAAKPAFSCRNSLFHGTTVVSDDPEWTQFIRNSAFGGIVRSRPTSDFHATKNTLGMLEEVFEILLNNIYLIWTAAQTTIPLGGAVEEYGSLGKAWSYAAELDDLGAALNHEKY
jgi:hypothetical protein